MLASKFPIWWKPEKVAYYEGNSWKTVTNYQPSIFCKDTVGVSPLDENGKAYFIAFDVDTVEVKPVKHLLKVFPDNVKPLVSVSGMKGYHVWLFLDKPLEADIAIEFAKLVKQKAGIECEIFPSSRRSKCLKLPGSLHPKTGAMEEFIDLKTRHSFDTQIVCQMLAEGYYRTPYTAIVDWVNVEGANIPQLVTRPKEAYNELAASEDLAAFLLELAGENFHGLGKPFCCILPGHEERYPSAEFYRSSNGTIVYHDYHCSKYGTPEFLTLAEVYHALMTGKIIKLTPVEGGRWLAELALRAGVFNDLAIQQKFKLECLDTVFHKWYSRSNLSDIVLKVWETIKSEAIISALSGFAEIKLSTRFLAEKAGITSSQANRAINLLCCLGFLQKVTSSEGMKGDRFAIGNIDLEQVSQRWEALNISSIKQLNRKLVSERLGEELAASIFRGISNYVSMTFNESRSIDVVFLKHE